MAKPYFESRRWIMAFRLDTLHKLDNLHIVSNTGDAPPESLYRSMKNMIYNDSVSRSSYQISRQLNDALQPVVDAMDEHVELLQGSVQQQYQQWKLYLKQLYQLETDAKAPGIAVE